MPGMISTPTRSPSEEIRIILQSLPALRFADVAADPSEARKYACDISVQDRKFISEGDAQNCGSGVVADAGQGEDIPRGHWKLSSVLRHDLLRRFEIGR